VKNLYQIPWGKWILTEQEFLEMVNKVNQWMKRKEK